MFESVWDRLEGEQGLLVWGEQPQEGPLGSGGTWSEVLGGGYASMSAGATGSGQHHLQRVPDHFAAIYSWLVVVTQREFH